MAVKKYPESIHEYEPCSEGNQSEHVLIQWSRRIKNIEITDSTLQEIFQKYGHITQILISPNSKRKAVVTFKSIKEAQMAQENIDQRAQDKLEGRTFHVSFCQIRNHGYDENYNSELKMSSVSYAGANPKSMYEIIPGLYVFEDIITTEKETEILNYLDSNDDKLWLNMKGRRVQHYGYEFDYKTKKCDCLKPLNNWNDVLLSLYKVFPSEMDKPDQLTVNEYLPGQGIAPHIDTHSAFSKTLTSLSVALPPRSLIIMTEACRYEWTHGIIPRKTDLIDGVQTQRIRRVSLTFRQIHQGDCNCCFKDQCDTYALSLAQGNQPETLAPTEMEKKYVHEFYQTISSHFSSTRYAPWPHVAAFVRSFSSGSFLADIGCGNGKYMLCAKPNTLCIGGDRSSSLVEICHQRDLNAIVFDAVMVPLRSNAFDGAVSIAVLHHLSTYKHRYHAAYQVVRVLRVGGRGLIYVWAQEQQETSRRQFVQHKQDIMVPWNLSKRFISKKKEDSEDCKDQVVQRYCHVFHEGELVELMESFSNIEIVRHYYDESNWCIEFIKTSL